MGEWKEFVDSPEADNLLYGDSLCFISIASYFGGEYPFDDDALNDQLPGFYIDTSLFANIHCFELNDIKVACGQDWSFLKMTIDEGEDLENDIEQILDTEDEETESDTDSDIEYDSDMDVETDLNEYEEDEDEIETDEPTPSPTAKVVKQQKKSTSTTLQPRHGEDCCSAISQISYDEINCVNISLNLQYIEELEQRWKNEQCGRKDKLPTDLMKGIRSSLSNDSDCDHLWAYFNQIHEICYKFDFVSNGMNVYNHFKSRGGYECFDKNTKECKLKEQAISDENNLDFDNFVYDTLEAMNQSMNVTLIVTVAKDKESESEMAEIEEDGGLTVTSLGILGLIIFSLTAYVLYWFCCSNTSKGYRQHSQFMNGGYDDYDTEEYQTRYRQKEVYNERINGSYDDDDDNDQDSDWSEDEQLGVVDESYSNKKKKKKKKKKSKKKKKRNEYDVSVDDVDHEVQMNDAVQVNENADYDQFYEQNETLQSEEEDN